MPEIESVQFGLFDFFIASDQIEPITTQTNISFTAQTPYGTSEPVRGLLVVFDSDIPDVLHFHIKCRVVFRFASEADIVEGNKLIRRFHHQAYDAFCGKANEALVVLGHNPMQFPDIGHDFE